MGNCHRLELDTSQTVQITGSGTASFTQLNPDIEDLMLNSSVGNSALDFDSYALPITASAAGTIGVNIAGSVADGWAITGLAISTSPVPEPATTTLLAAGGAAAAGYGWRKRKELAGTKRIRGQNVKREVT